MRVICHIGHHKTGTSSLQVFLSQNSYKLLKNGIYYPWVETEGAAIAQRKLLQQKDLDEVLPWNYREAHNTLALRMFHDSPKKWKMPPERPNTPHSKQMFFALNHQLECLSPETVVLCSEIMSHFGTENPTLISNLRHGFRKAEDFEVWCTLRRPDEHLVSWYGQAVRLGIRPIHLSEKGGVGYKSIHFDYRAVIEPWQKRLPKCTFNVRPYSEIMERGGSVNDFGTSVGIDVGAYIPVPRLNESIAPGATAVLQKIGAVAPKKVSRSLNPLFRQLSGELKLYSSKEVEVLGQSTREEIFENFKPIHKWLSEFTKRPSFFTDIDQMLVCNSIPEEEAYRQFLDHIDAGILERIPDATARKMIVDLKNGRSLS